MCVWICISIHVYIYVDMCVYVYMAISILYLLQESGLDVHHGKISRKHGMDPFGHSLGKVAWFSFICVPNFALHRSFEGGCPSGVGHCHLAAVQSRGRLTLRPKCWPILLFVNRNSKRRVFTHHPCQASNVAWGCGTYLHLPGTVVYISVGKSF